MSRGLNYERNAFRIKDGDKRFLIDYLPFKTFYEPYTRDSIRIIASSGVTLRMFLELLKVVEICGHTILAVSGFDDTSGDIRVPGTVYLNGLNHYDDALGPWGPMHEDYEAAEMQQTDGRMNRENEPRTNR
jgi:hypothetical protein